MGAYCRNIVYIPIGIVVKLECSEKYLKDCSWIVYNHWTGIVESQIQQK